MLCRGLAGRYWGAYDGKPVATKSSELLEGDLALVQWGVSERAAGAFACQRTALAPSGTEQRH